MSYIGKSPSVKSVKYTPQSSIPLNAQEGQTFYSDGTASAEGMYIYKDGAWVSLGSSASGINYILNPDAESGITGWAEFDDIGVSTPVDGTGGTASNITLSQNTTTPLRGVADFKVAKGAVDAIGEGVSYDFTIDNADKAKVMVISFDYSVTANFADDDMGVWIYDVTNSNIIEVSDRDIKASSLSETHIATFQTASDSTSYRLIIMCKSTSALAYDLHYDNVQTGPNKQAVASVITDWQDYTPTGSWTSNTTYTGEYRRVGDTLEVKTTLPLTGAPNATDLTLNLPSGLSIDTNKLTSINGQNVLGTISIRDASASVPNDLLIGVVSYNSTTVVRAKIEVASSSYTTADNIDATTPITFGSGDTVTLNYSVPIQGWASTAIVADEYATREIFVDGRGNGGASITADVTNVDFTEVEDLTASWDGTTFTAPSKGTFQVAGNTLATAGHSGSVQAYINGTGDKFIGLSTGSITSKEFNGIFRLEAGDELTLRISASITLSNSTTAHHIAITRIKDSRSLSASAKVFMYATNSSNQSITDKTWTQITGWTTSEDTHRAFDASAGDFTAPATGIYSVHCGAALSSASGWELNEQFAMRIQKDSTDIRQKNLQFRTSDASAQSIGVEIEASIDVMLTKGEVVSVDILQQNDASINLSSTSTKTFITIKKE